MTVKMGSKQFIEENNSDFVAVRRFLENRCVIFGNSLIMFPGNACYRDIKEKNKEDED